MDRETFSVHSHSEGRTRLPAFRGEPWQNVALDARQFQPSRAVAQLVHVRDIGLVQHGEEQIRHRRAAGIANVLSAQSPGAVAQPGAVDIEPPTTGALGVEWRIQGDDNRDASVALAWRRTGDNTNSVAEGLAKTAGVITGAALIMVSVFSAFALAESITIKSIGVGMAIAVLIDATIVRVLLVPATMRLMGKWNWWAPGFMARFADRLGFSHVEDDEDALPEPETRPAPALG